MSDPSTELQGAICTVLKADAALMLLVDDIYDDTRLTDAQKSTGKPWGAAGAYINFGPEQILPDDAACIYGDEHVIQLDVWSRKVGRLHCKAICYAVLALMREGIVMNRHAMVTLTRRQFQILPDREHGVTHGVLQFSIRIEINNG